MLAGAKAQALRDAADKIRQDFGSINHTRVIDALNHLASEHEHG